MTKTTINNYYGSGTEKKVYPESDKVKTVKDVSGFKLKKTIRGQEVLLLAEAKKFGVALSDTAISLFKVCFYTFNVMCLLAFMIVRSFVKSNRKGSNKETKERKPFEIKI